MTSAETTPEAASAPRVRASGGKLALRFVEALAAGVIGGFVLLALAPIVLGWRPYTVLTGSMRPVIQPGDVVMDEPVRISEATVGDVVTFSDPGRQGVLVTHRIRSIMRGPVQTDVETRGDANNTSERWTINTDAQVGRVVYVIPKVGHVASAIRNPIGIVLLVVIPVLGIGFSVLRQIWREDEEDDEDDPEEGTGAAAQESPADRPTSATAPADSPDVSTEIAPDR